MLPEDTVRRKIMALRSELMEIINEQSVDVRQSLHEFACKHLGENTIMNIPGISTQNNESFFNRFF